MKRISQAEFAERRGLSGGHPGLHQELSWWADGAKLGVVIRDKIDNDFSFVRLEHEDGMFRAVDCGVSLPSEQAAETALRKSMAEVEGEDE